jgi:serine/threonine protein kinase
LPIDFIQLQRGFHPLICQRPAAHRDSRGRKPPLAGKLNHPHIVSIYDAATDDDMSYVVMEHVAGGTLEQFVAAIRAHNQKANIVVAQEAGGVRLRAIELRDAGIDQALEAACAVAAAGTEVRVREHKGHGEPVYSHHHGMRVYLRNLLRKRFISLVMLSLRSASLRICRLVSSAII